MHELDTMTPEQRVKYLEKMERKRGKRAEESKMCAAYYRTDNPDIMERRKLYAAQTEENGIRAVAKENRFAANERVASSFFRDITDQKVQYLAGEGADVSAVDDAQADAVAAVFGPLKRQVRRIGQECRLPNRTGSTNLQALCFLVG